MLKRFKRFVVLPEPARPLKHLLCSCYKKRKRDVSLVFTGTEYKQLQYYNMIRFGMTKANTEHPAFKCLIICF